MIGNLVEKDLRVLVRHRAFLGALLAYPLLLAAVLGGAFDDPPATFHVGVVNEDAGGGVLRVGGENLTSETLVELTRTTGEVTLFEDRASAVAELRQARLDAVVVIPAGFIGNLSGLDGSARLELVVDEADPVRAAVSGAALEGAMGDFLRSVVEKKVDDVLRELALAIEGGERRIFGVPVRAPGLNDTIRDLEEVRESVTGEDRDRVDGAILFLRGARDVLLDAGGILRATAMPIDVEARGAVSADPRLRDVVLPGALVLAAYWSGSLAAVALWTTETEAGSLARLRAAPVGLGRHVLAKAALALALVLLQTGILLAVASAVWGTTAVKPLLAALVLLAAGGSAVTLGAAAAGISRGTGGAALLVVLALLPMMLLGGLFYPLAYMPEAAQRVAGWLPLTHAVEALRGAMIRGSPVAEVGPALAALVAFTLLFGAVAAAAAARRS